MDNLNNIPNAGNWGDAASKLNDNFNKIKQAVTTVENTTKNNKGYFTSLSALNTAFPSPKAGLTAYVYDEASSTNYYIYNAVNGAWVTSSIEAPSVGVDISGYTKTGGSTKTTKDIDDDLVQLVGDVSGLAPKQSVELVKDLLDSLADASPNLLDKSKITSGNYILSEGNKGGTNNWICVEMGVLPNTTYTLSGHKGINSTIPRMFFINSNGTADQSKTIMGGGADDETPITFTTSSETTSIRINIGTATDIGLNPTDNIYANRLQLEKGIVATEYFPYGMATLKNVKSEIVADDKNPINSVAVSDYVNVAIENKVGDFIKTSPNILDKSKITSGNYILTAGNKVNSNNWICIEMDVEANTEYVLSGHGGLNLDAPRMFFIKANGTADQSKTIMSQGLSIETPITFTTTEETVSVKINIAQTTNIGLTPTDNEYANKVQLEIGSEATEYMGYATSELKNVMQTVTDENPKSPVSGNAVIDYTDNYINEILGSIIGKSPNILDKSLVTSGNYVLSSGNKVESNNWISIEVSVEPNQTYTLSGIKGVMNTSLARLFQYPATGTAITSATIMSDGTLDDITFTTTADTYRVGINIGTTTNIGDNPTDNEFVDSIQLEEGNVATPYLPYGSITLPYVDDKIEEVYDYIDNFVPDSNNDNWIIDSRTPYPPTLNNVEIRETNEASVCWVDRFGRVFGRSGKQFYHSTDSAQTWTLIKDFGIDGQNIGTCRDMEDGEIIIITAKSSLKNCCVLKSTGWNNGNPTGEVTFTEVFEIESYENINSYWGTHVYKNKVLLSEYGNRGAALKAYLSNDYGATFSVVFNFADYADDVPNAHIHGSCIDPYRGWLWIVTGDVTNSSTLYSKDDGATWITLEDINNKKGTVPHQQVTVFPMPDCVLFLTDRTNLNANPPLVSGVYRININSENIDNLKASDIKLAYRADYSSSLVQMGTNAFKNYYNGQQPTYFGFKRTSGGSGEDVPCGIFATFDGRNIFKVFESPILPSQGGFRMVYGPDMNGKILANYDLSATESKLFVADASDFY